MSDRFAVAPPSQRLERGVLSVPNAIALSTSAMAPVLAVVLNAPAAVPAAGAALPLSFLIAFIAATLVGNTVMQFARQFPSAGSFYTFNSKGLGSAGGFFTGWLFWFGYAVLAPGLFAAFGAFVHDYMISTLQVEVSWWFFSLIAMAFVFGLSLRSIKASVNLDLALLITEVVIFLVLASEQRKLWADPKYPLFYENVYKFQLNAYRKAGTIANREYDLNSFFAAKGIWENMNALKVKADETIANLKLSGTVGPERQVLIDTALKHYKGYNFLDADRFLEAASA